MRFRSFEVIIDVTLESVLRVACLVIGMEWVSLHWHINEWTRILRCCIKRDISNYIFLSFFTGAFLIPYFIFMFIEGIPLMLLEFAIGQKMRNTAVRIWKDIHPALFGVGIGCMMVSLLLCMYYVIVIAWCLLYLFLSMTSDLPWSSDEACSNTTGYNALKQDRDYWKANYTSYPNNSNAKNASEKLFQIAAQKVNNFSDCCVIDPPQWYFYTKVLDISTDIEDYTNGLNGKLVGCLILAWVIVYLCVVKGIKSSGKVSYPSVAKYCISAGAKSSRRIWKTKAIDTVDTLLHVITWVFVPFMRLWFCFPCISSYFVNTCRKKVFFDRVAYH